jgi:hypothetical protein
MQSNLTHQLSDAHQQELRRRAAEIRGVSRPGDAARPGRMRRRLGSGLAAARIRRGSRASEPARLA